MSTRTNIPVTVTEVIEEPGYVPWFRVKPDAPETAPETLRDHGALINLRGPHNAHRKVGDTGYLTWVRRPSSGGWEFHTDLR